MDEKKEGSIKISIAISENLIYDNVTDLKSLLAIISNLILNFCEDDELFYENSIGDIEQLNDNTFKSFKEESKKIIVIYNNENQMLNKEVSQEGTFIFASKKENDNKTNIQKIRELELNLIEKEKTIQNLRNLKSQSKTDKLTEIKDFLNLKSSYDQLNKSYEKLYNDFMLMPERLPISNNELKKNEDKIKENTRLTCISQQLNLSKPGSFNFNYDDYASSGFYESNNNMENVKELIDIETIFGRIKNKIEKKNEIINDFVIYLSNFERFFNCGSRLSINDQCSNLYFFNNQNYFCNICKKLIYITNDLPRILKCLHYTCNDHFESIDGCDLLNQI